MTSAYMHAHACARRHTHTLFKFMRRTLNEHVGVQAGREACAHTWTDSWYHRDGDV